jgi:hypothetical protein
LWIWAFFLSAFCSCDSVSRSILLGLVGVLALLFQAIALSAKGLFFTIRKIFCDKIFLMGACLRAT